MFIRALKRGKHTYYAEVETYRDEQNRRRQRVVRYLGKNPKPPPAPVSLTGVHFGILAMRLMEGTLTQRDVFQHLEQIGKPIPAEELEAIGIRFEFAKKTLTLRLYPPASNPTVPPRARRAKAASGKTTPGRKTS